jgi:arginyl-tRNA synthetase
MRLERYLEDLASNVFLERLGLRAPAMLRATQDSQHGDYQLNGLLPLSKQLNKPARELGTDLLSALTALPPVQSATIAGPGFINLTLAPAWIAAELSKQLAEPQMCLSPTPTRRRIVVDYSAPNIAKQMHVGHLRSTILGAALVKLLRAVGHEVISDNHIGDWGTQFGLLLAGLKQFGSADALAEQPVAELERIYKQANDLAKTDEAFAQAARAELAKLQNGDPENRTVWKRLVDISRDELQALYSTLDVSFDHWLGESAYHDRLAPLVQLLLERGIAVEDQGAVCVFFSEPPELAKNKTPLIVKKSDGAFLYATTDIATVQYRLEEFGAELCLYVVDSRQRLHFQQVAAVTAKLGLGVELKVVDFGSVLGMDGKPLKTRDGGTITLSALLQEAESRAMASIHEEGLEVAESELSMVAKAVGIGAVKYADLRQNRLSDYQFDWDKMISFRGNAGPYLQYAHARVRAMFRKGELDFEAFSASEVTLQHPSELALGKQLLRWDEIIHMAAESYQPHLLCDHLYAVARHFSNFYQECPVLKADEPDRTSRLALAKLCALQLRAGLEFLGIQALERM